MKPKFHSRLLNALSAITLALSTASAFGATETFNTPGTFNWVCPGGVTSIQVECWGGGGAGGAGKGIAASAQQNGGGGGGGAYARKNLVTVTPGATYTFTIPAAAVSGANGLTDNDPASTVPGGNVTFTGDAGNVVTALGGAGGRNAIATANTPLGRAGGAGGSATSSVGDVKFAGGTGATGTTGASGASGSGGGAGGSTAAGGAGSAVSGGTSSSTPLATPGGTGGATGGGTGGSGYGAGAVAGNTSAGSPGLTPGGGGGGAHNVGNTTQLGGTGGLGQVALTYTDPPATVKANNTDNLNLTSSWTAHVPHSLIAEWDSTVLAANTTSLGANLTFDGIKISSPGGPVTINPGNTLTLGEAAIDLDLSAATQDLTVNCNLALGAANVWDVAATRALTLGGTISGAQSVTKQGLGTATLSFLSATPANNYSGTTTLSGGTLALTTTSPSLTGGLTFGATPSTLDLSGVASSATFAGAMLVQTNSVTANTITLGAAKTLTINGGLTMSNNTDAAETRLTMTGGGALVVNGASILVGNNTAGSNFSSEAHLDLAALDSFTTTLSTTLTVQASGDNSTADPASLTLSNVANSITAAAVRVGNSGTGSTNRLWLGSGTNVIKTDLINLGAGSRDTGVIDFAGSGGSVSLRNVAGTGRIAAVNLGIQSASSTAVTTANLIDVTGNTADIAIGTFATSLGAKTAANSNNLRFDSGTLDIRTINMAFAKGTGASTNNITIGGGNVRLGGSAAFSDAGTGTLTLATAGSGALIINGGTVTTTASLLKGTGGTGTATVTLNGGTLDMGGTNIGAATDTVVLAAQSGTLQNLGQLNGGGALTKTTTGTLVLTGTNTYTGGTNVNAGTLLLSGAFNMPSTGTLQVNAGGNFSLADGPASTTTTTAALGLANGASLAFDWNGGNLDMLTSTAAATTAGAVGISINGTSPTGSGGTLISSPLGGLSGAGYFLVNNIDYAAPLIVTDTTVSIGSISTGLTPLANAYWLGGQLTGSGLGAMALSVGAASNWATDAAGTSAGGLVPNGSAVNVIFSATGATEQASVTTGANINLGSITFNDSAAVTIGGSHTVTLNSTSATAATSSGSGTTVTPGSAISVTSSANAANAFNANLTLAANQTWNIASGKTLSVGGAVGGAAALTLGDAGTLVLSGTNTYSGNTSVNAGTLEISGTGRIYGGTTNTATVTVASGAGITLSGAATNNALGFGASATWAVSGTINSTGGSAQSLPGNVTLNNGTLTGIASISPNEQYGTFFSGTGGSTITANGATNTISAGNVGMASGGTLTLATPLSGDALSVSSALGVNAGTPQLAGALTKTGLGTVTLGGTNIYTGNTNVTGGTLNITGTVTGNTTSSTLAYGSSAANTVVNVSNDMTLSAITGANNAGSAAVYNQTAGTVNVHLAGVGSAGSFVSNSGYGYFNLTGGTFKSNGSFSIGTNNAASNGVAYVGGTGFLDWSGTGNQTLGYATPASLTVGPGGSVSRGASTATTWLATNGGSAGIVNIAGGSLDLGTAGNVYVTNTASATSVTINLAGGTLTMGKALATNGGTTGTLYANYAGGTLKASATLASSPMNVLTSASTLFGPIDNVGTSQDFTGGLTIDTNGFSMPYGNALGGVTGNGVKQANISVTGGSGYTGAPLVQFTGGTGTPASGYAVISGGAVTGIVITSPGDYTVDPTGVTLTGGGGTGASVALSALTANATDSGLTKINSGTLTLSGANTYVGPTTVNGGTLQLNGSAAITPTTSGITVNNVGTTLGFTSGSASTLDLTGKPLSLGGGTLAFDIGSSAVNDTITVNAFSLTANSSIAINPIGAFNSGGSYTVLTSATPISTGAFSLSGTTVGRLSVTPTVTTSTVTITPVLDEGIWNQAGGGNWSVGNPGGPSAPNWDNYKPTVAGDAALFGSAILAPSTINVDTAHILGYMRFDNAVNAYTIGSNASSNLTLDNGAAPALALVTSGAHTIAENVALASNLIVAPVAGATLTVSGNLTGTGTSLQKIDAGMLELSGTANSYTGTTTVSAGTLSLTGSLTGGAAVTVDGTGVLNQSSTGVISGASSITHSSSGTSTLAGANTSTGTINVTNGKLNISNWSASTMGTVLVSTGGTLEFSGSATYNIATRMTVGATSATTGTVNQTGGTVSFTASDCLLIGTGANIGSTGIYNLSGGTLTSYASGTRGVILGTNNGNNATFNLSGTGNLNLASSILMIGRSDTAQPGCTALFNQTGGTATVNTLTIGGTGTGTATGTMTLTAGTFVANTFTKLALAQNDVATINISGTAVVTLPAFPTTRGAGATATINFDGGTLKPNVASLTYMEGLTNAFIKAGGARFDTTGFDTTINQNLLTDGVSIGGSLTKAGTNTLTLSGTNTYTGGTNITGGALAVTNSAALGTGAVTISGTRLAVATGLSVSNPITINANTGASGRGLVEAGSSAGTTTLTGPITINSGAAAGGHFAAPTANTVLHLAGPITSSSVTLSQRDGSVMYSGGGTGYSVMTATGTTIVGANNGIATTAAVTVGASAACTLDLNGYNQSLDGIFKGANAATIGNSSTTTDSTLTTTGTSSFAGVIQNVISPGTRKVNLAVASGALTLSGANTFSGDITVANGTLIGAGATNSPGITVLGSRSNTRTITVNNGGILRLDSGNVLGSSHTATTAPTLVINNGGTVTNGGIATNNALNNVVLDGGTLTSTTGHTSSSPPNAPVYGAWNLNGSVTSTGTSTISTTDPTKGWIMLKVVGDKTTDFNVSSGTLTVSAPVVDNPTDGNIGSLSKSGAGAMVLSGVNTYTGDTTVSAGSLQLADNAQLKFVLGNASNNNNDITGAGTVTLDGDFVIDTSAADALATGTWTLENVSTLTGAYGSTFSVIGFSDIGGNKWEKANGLTKKYTFDEATGILTLGPSASYSSWAAVNAIGSTPEQDKDGDGVSNAVEYVLGGTVGTNDLDKLPIVDASGANLVFSFERDRASIDGSTTITIEVGTTLAIWTNAYNVGTNTGNSDAGVTVAENSPIGFDTITLTVPKGTDPKKFAHLKVSVTP